MAEKYELDLTEAKLPSWWPKDAPLVLPLVKGAHQYDYDLVPAELPSDFYAELVRIIKSKFERQGRIGKEDWPIGFNAHTCPSGSVIRVLA